MELSELISYLNQTGWKESPQFADHYVREGTKGIVAIDSIANEAFIVEQVGCIPWSCIINVENFERDLAHLQ